MFSVNKKTVNQNFNKKSVVTDFSDTFVPSILAKSALTMSIKADVKYLKCLINNPFIVSSEPLYENSISQDYRLIHEAIANVQDTSTEPLKISGYKQEKSEYMEVEII